MSTISLPLKMYFVAILKFNSEFKLRMKTEFKD